MADMLGDTTLVSDIRGAAHGPRRSAVLEDPTGNRRKRLRIVARLIALSMSIWLLALLLGAVGITPVGSIPFVRVFKPPASPPVHKLPRPHPPTVAELQPALSAASAPSSTTGVQRAVAPVAKTPTKHTRKLRSPAATTPATPTTPAPPTTPGRANGKAKGKPQPATTTPTTTSTTPGQSGTAPGHTRTTPPGKSKQTTGTSTTPTPTG
jgi:hypothetical protein